jgi:hypothetical protein
MDTTDTTYTLTDQAPITLKGRTFTVQTQEYADGHCTVWLTGTNGGVFFLREYLGRPTNVRQVISWKSGQALRIRGNEVRVTLVDDVITIH